MLGAPLSEAWLESVGTISDPVDSDRIKQMLVQGLAEGRVAFALEGNHWLKGFECLNCMSSEQVGQVEA
jgi:hypothetical protein